MEMNPTMIPYLPSMKWLLDADRHGNMPTREYTRTRVSSNSPEGMMLTVPVVGGSSAVKRLHPEELEVSGHGDWTRIHLGAIDAAYGKEPYFQHFFPGIAEVIRRYPVRLADMNRKLFAGMLDEICYRATSEDVESFRKANPQRYDNIRRRMLTKIDICNSWIEAIFRLGPDLAFLLPKNLTLNS